MLSAPTPTAPAPNLPVLVLITALPVLKVLLAIAPELLPTLAAPDIILDPSSGRSSHHRAHTHTEWHTIQLL